MGGDEDEVVPATAMLFAVMSKVVPGCVKEHRLVDRLLLLRHGERQDHAAPAWRGSAHLPPTDPPLSPDGRLQCLETALRYRALRRAKSIEQRVEGLVSVLVTSPFQRCLETALLLNIVAFDGKLAIFVDPQLADWQQPRIYRRAPVIAGHYTLCSRSRRGGEAAVTSLRFCPHHDALRASLVPFLQALPTDLAAEAPAWLACLRRWLDRHHSMPVWTSRVAADHVHSQLAALTNDAATPPCLTQCGLPFPETRGDLQRRCEQFLRTHYDDESRAMLPPRLVAAVQREWATRLPRSWQTCHEVPASRHTARALLPPMHTLVVTHADVIASLLAVCCPRHHASGSGQSVPSCSLTLLTRVNRYYQVCHTNEIHERDTTAGHEMRHRTHSAITNTAAEAVSDEWVAVKVGTTDLLRTKILVQFNK